MSQTQSLLECVLCDGPLKTHWTLQIPEEPRWVTMHKGEGTWQEHRILCGVCLWDYWKESRKSWKKFEMSSGERIRSHRARELEYDRRSQDMCALIIKKLMKNSPDDPWNPGRKQYDEDTEVVIRGKYHGEGEVHDDSDSDKEATKNAPIVGASGDSLTSMDLDDL